MNQGSITTDLEMLSRDDLRLAGAPIGFKMSIL